MAAWRERTIKAAWRGLASGLAGAAIGLLAACGGANTTGDLIANLDGTLPTCTIADGGNSCAATITWRTVYAQTVSVLVAGTVVSTATSGTVSPVVNFGTVTVELDANGASVATATVTAQCAATSFWNGTACQPSIAFAILSFAVADGATGVAATTPLAGTANQTLAGGSATLSCHDSLDAGVALPATASVSTSATTFTVIPNFAGYTTLPHRAQCTLTATVNSIGLQTLPLGPITFTTDGGPVLSSLLVSAGLRGQPSFVDAATGAQTSATGLSNQAADCFGAYEPHTALVRTICGVTTGPISAIWDIDPVTGASTQVAALKSLFAGNTTDPQVVIDHAGNQYFTHGALQADNTTDSAIIVVHPDGSHVTVSWDWGTRHDWITRLLLDEPGGRLVAVSHLGLVQVVALDTLAVTQTVDLAASVNDALLNGSQVVVSMKTRADGANLVVYDPVQQQVVPGVAVVTGGRGTAGLALSGGDLLVASSDLAGGVTTAKICRMDPATYAMRPGTPCTASGGATQAAALVSDGLHVFGDQDTVLAEWPLDLSAATPLQTYDGPVARLRLLQN